MYRIIAGLVALVAFVQVIEGVTFETTHFVDIVAQKLEDHLQGKNLEDKITYDECKAASDEFEQWDQETSMNNRLHGPLSVARNYMDDFLRQPIEFNSAKYEKNEELAEEFIEKLESTYKKVRPWFTYRKPLQCGAGMRRGAKTCALVDALTGKGEPLTPQMMDESYNEIQETFAEMIAIWQRGDLLQNLDEWLEIQEFINTPERYVCSYGLSSLMSDESDTKLEQGDPDEIQKYMDKYESELANFVYPE